MAWHGCFHCAIRYVDLEGRLCERCREIWGVKSNETCNCRKCYHSRVERRSVWFRFENAPEESPDWAGFLDSPDGDPVWPKYGTIYVGENHPRKGKEYE